jgi:hypothetical protein
MLNDGMMGLHTEAVWHWLLELGTAPAPNSKDSGKSVDQEIADIKQVMATDYRAYERDPRMQDRYRALLEAKANGTAASPVDSEDAEIARLQAQMRDRRSEYWRGPNAAVVQARYRMLISRRAR